MSKRNDRTFFRNIKQKKIMRIKNDVALNFLATLSNKRTTTVSTIIVNELQERHIIGNVCLLDVCLHEIIGQATIGDIVEILELCGIKKVKWYHVEFFRDLIITE